MAIPWKQIGIGAAAAGGVAALGFGGYRLSRRFYDPRRNDQLAQKVDVSLAKQADTIKFWESFVEELRKDLAANKEAVAESKKPFVDRATRLRAKEPGRLRRWLGWV